MAAFEPFTYKITGLGEVEKMFSTMLNKERNKVLRPAVRAAAKLVLEDARRLAPDSPGSDGITDTGDLRKSLRIASKSRMRRGSIAYVVEAPTIVTVSKVVKSKTKSSLVWSSRAKKKKEKSQVFNARWYAGFVERGTKHRPAQPFLRPAADNNREAVQNIIVTAIKKHFSFGNRVRRAFGL